MARLKGQILHQVRKVGPFRFLDQAPRHDGIEAQQVLHHFLYLVGLAAVVVGHAERVPGVAVHGLQLSRAGKRGGGFRVLFQGGMRHAHAIPGPVERGLEAHGLLEGLDGTGFVMGLIADEAEVEPALGIAGPEAQRLQIISGRLLVLMPRRVEIGQASCGLGKIRVGAQGLAVCRYGWLRAFQGFEQEAAQIMAPRVKFHAGELLYPIQSGTLFKGKSGMAQWDLFLLSALRAVVEVAGFALLGQGLLAVLAGKGRQQNFVYQLFQVVTRPVVRAVRFITPRFILDQHMPLVSFFVLVWLWVALAFAKRYLCALHGLSC